MSIPVYCLVDDTAKADQIVGRLRSQNISFKDISILYPDHPRSEEYARETPTKVAEGTTAGVTTGGVLGGTLGLLVGIGSLAIPGIGPFIAAGPIMAALGGAAIGATVGGITGALIGLGIPETEARIYEGKIRSGNILLTVHALTYHQVDDVKKIFADCGGMNIASNDEFSTPGIAQTTQVL